MLKQFMREVSDLLGEERVISDPSDLEAYVRDYWPYLVIKEAKGARLEPRPKVVLLPETEDEVVEIVRSAEREKTVLIPYAGGTGVLGGTLGPDQDFVVIDLGRMNWIRWFDEEAGIVDVGPGTLLIELEKWLNDRGKSLRHYPQSLPEAAIGGLVATRSSGQYSTGYGSIENFVKGLNIVIPSIGLLRIPPAPRRSLLYPLKELFIGSEGTLGIITRVYLEAVDLQERSQKISWICDDFIKSLKVAKIIVRKRVSPELFRLFDNFETQITFGDEGSLSIGMIEGEKELVKSKYDTISRIVKLNGCKLVEDKKADVWLEERFDVIKKVKDLFKVGLAFETIEVSATWGRIIDVYKHTIESLLRLKEIEYAGAHSGHFYGSGAALYFTIVFDVEKLDGVYDKIWDVVMRTTNKYGGSIGHHHGVGIQRWKWIGLEYGNNGIKLMSAIKKALDPNGVVRDLMPFKTSRCKK